MADADPSGGSGVSGGIGCPSPGPPGVDLDHVARCRYDGVAIAKYGTLFGLSVWRSICEPSARGLRIIEPWSEILSAG